VRPPSLTFTEEWLCEYSKRTGKNAKDVLGLEGRGKEVRRSKYGNRTATRGAEVFDSEHEARVYDDLLLLMKAGEICSIERQKVFILPGGVKYIADFEVTNPDGSLTVIDAKSEATRKDKVYRIKRRLMRECLGITIREV
jgi:hypothetical protein